MTFAQRVKVAAIITPALMLTFFGLFVCSPLPKSVNLYLGFALNLLAAYSCAHCIVIAACMWRDANK